MPKTTDIRPLVERLQKRILKKHGGNAEPVNEIAGGYLTDTDSSLHQQSVDSIQDLVTALALVTNCLSKALIGGEVSAEKAGAALIAADEALTKYAPQ